MRKRIIEKLEDYGEIRLEARDENAVTIDSCVIHSIEEFEDFSNNYDYVVIVK